MRSLGQIDGRKPTEQFVAFLLTQKIKTHIDGVDGKPDCWEVWVRNEDQLAEAMAHLQAFRQNPTDSRYELAMKEATRLLDAEQKTKQAAARNIRRMDTSRTVGPGLSRGPIPPLTLTLVILAVVVSFVSNFMDERAIKNNKWGEVVVNELSFVEPAAWEKTKDPAASLKRGEIWRAITPIFMHGSMLHLAFNLFMLVSLGRLTERIQGTPKFAVFVLMLAVFPNLLQGLMPFSLGGSPFFVGISGVVYGLFGYIWIRSSLHPEMGIMIPMPMVVVVLGLIVLGFAAGMSDAQTNWRLANFCHLGGLLVGIAVAYASEKK
ncbi:MAG: rhomboid family intramembrane serine protease [Pirellulaceae bacterium]|nr:rhomboid family intramembrane serine protease [Pirellulaceae bacterium]